MDIPQPVIFLAILLAIPLQIYFSPERSSDLDYYAVQTKAQLSKFWDKLTSRFLLNDEAPGVKSDADDDTKIDEEDVEKGYFGGGSGLRDPRPPQVQFRVGDVVYHKINKYRGVIVGWDERPNAPEFWLLKVRGPKKDRDDDEPNYAVLIDTRNRIIPQLGYVLQRNIEKADGKVIHPLVDKYFERYQRDQGTYVLRPWLRQVYPND